MDGSESAGPDRRPSNTGPLEGPPEIPAAPSIPGPPWLIVLASTVASLVALLVLVSLARNDAVDVPPAWLFAASGIVMAGIGGIAVWLACARSRLVSRSAIALGAAFACMGIAKFALAPLGFLDENRDRRITIFFGQRTLIVTMGIVVLALYVVVIWVISRIARRRLGDASRFRLSAFVGGLLGLAAIGLGLPFVLLVAGGPLSYLTFVFTSAAGLGVTIALMAAIGLVTHAFLTAQDRAQVLARASMLATAASIAIAFVLLFQVLWVVFMLTIIAVWPLRIVTPK
jgi:hypothetical protein